MERKKDSGRKPQNYRRYHLTVIKHSADVVA